MCHGQMLGDALVQASKRERRCDECGAVIRVGDPYRAAAMRGETPWVECMECHAYMEFVIEDADDGCYIRGDLRSNARDAIIWQPSLARDLRALLRSAKEKIAEARRALREEEK